MDKFTEEYKTFAVAAYFQNQNSPSIARTAFRKMLKMKTFANGPIVQTITRWAMEFEATGSVASRSTRSKPVTARTPEVIQRVQCIVKRKPVMSIRRIASAAGFKKSTTQVILRRNLQLRAFKIQIVKSLKSTDPANRLEFVQVMGRVSRVSSTSSSRMSPLSSGWSCQQAE